MQPRLLEEVLDSSTSIKRLREISRDITTPAECLYELFELYFYYSYILIGVAQNPNTPPNILQQLFRRFPNQVINNCVIDLLILENPNFISRLCETYCDVFRYKELPCEGTTHLVACFYIYVTL
ncbi:hypothetical protein DSM106972_021040 [Dulcicalothrix desertica PCC 7102]|uniref:Uncharacterized protein n=1 Tax=Dulcicalothrix desertica PCC 7102 TaxID=232991 RepID=A0A3S1CPC8_9CYAN|nr:hypothetical protein [Dulcicalothrix desertica]RUT07844.1 hypothetical protein DSM106972_021040 [Dulcicalothrix desertica PCC 7102]TWH39367.1 hypothetical protein CAL7102_08596 [Dulcicalothrix desertica PCC 7102]